MNKEKLLKFIAKAHTNTYGAPKELKDKFRCKSPIQNQHKDYEFNEGEFIYHDSYAGSFNAPGREVIFFKDNPVWAMAYQGKINPKFDNEFYKEKVFPFLKKALRNIDETQPFRGPKKFIDNEFENFRYVFEIVGDYSYFKGQEKIFYNNKVVFIQDIMGCLIK